MDRIAAVIVTHSRRILAATGLITLVAVAMLFRMNFNADVASFVLEGNPTGEQFAALQEKYDSADPITVVASLTDGSSFTDPDGLARLVELRNGLEDVTGIGAVASFLPEENPITGRRLTAEAVRSLPAPALGRLISTSPVAPLLLDDGATDTMLFATPVGDSVAAARAVKDVQTPDGMQLTFAGNPMVFASVIEILSLFLLFIPPLVIVLMVGVFYLNIGDRRLSILAVLPAIFGSLWTFGLIFGLGREVDIVTVIVPIFVIVMGSADGLHFITHFQDESDRTGDKTALVASALHHVGVPMILTTISTAAGFASLLFTDVEPIRQLGMFAAIGITFAGIISFFSLPALMSRITISSRAHHAVLGPRVTSAMKRALRSRIPAAALALGLIGFAGFFVPRIDVNPDQLFFFKNDDPVRVAFEKTEQLFGGATPLFGEFAFDPSAGLSQLGDVRAISDRMEQLPGIKEVFSVADVAASLPPDQVGRIMSGDVSLPFGDMVSADGLRFVVFPADFSTDDLTAWTEFAAEEPQIRVFTGMPIVWDEIARLVLRSQVVSLAVAFALVAAMLGLAYRRLRQTLVSLVPIVITVLVLLGFLAASGIQLNLLTAVLSSIVIGVGIDYAIHFVAAIDLARRDGPGYVLRAIDSAGRPIIANALGIAIGLSALFLSPLRIHAQVATIMWVSMITAAATALLVIPALLPRDGVSPAATGEHGPAIHTQRS